MELVKAAIESANRELMAKKDALIMEAITKKVAEPFNMQEELKRMFPRLRQVCQPGCEHWYWNDGSIGGLRLISFYPDDMLNSQFSEQKYSMSMSIRYRM